MPPNVSAAAGIGATDVNVVDNMRAILAGMIPGDPVLSDRSPYTSNTVTFKYVRNARIQDMTDYDDFKEYWAIPNRTAPLTEAWRTAASFVSWTMARNVPKIKSS